MKQQLRFRKNEIPRSTKSAIYSAGTVRSITGRSWTVGCFNWVSVSVQLTKHDYLLFHGYLPNLIPMLRELPFASQERVVYRYPGNILYFLKGQLKRLTFGVTHIFSKSIIYAHCPAPRFHIRNISPQNPPCLHGTPCRSNIPAPRHRW